MGKHATAFTIWWSVRRSRSGRQHSAADQRRRRDRGHQHDSRATRQACESQLRQYHQLRQGKAQHERTSLW